jgi:hypothetical protein
MKILRWTGVSLEQGAASVQVTDAAYSDFGDDECECSLLSHGKRGCTLSASMKHISTCTAGILLLAASSLVRKIVAAQLLHSPQIVISNQ